MPFDTRKFKAIKLELIFSKYHTREKYITIQSVF